MSSGHREDDERHAREAILARRLRFVKLAVAGVAAATTATSCACLTPLTYDAAVVPADAGTDAAEDAR